MYDANDLPQIVYYLLTVSLIIGDILVRLFESTFTPRW